MDTNFLMILFLKLLNMGINAGWLIIAVTILRHFMKKAPKGLTCMLWALVAVRLLCPVSLESALSLIPHTQTISLTHTENTQNPVINSSISSYISEPAAPASNENSSYMLLHTACILWIVGLFILLGYALVSYLRIRCRMQEAIPIQDDIWICDAVHSPFILGIIKPRIYLSSSLDPTQISYVLAHEQAHLKRHDHWWKLLGYLLVTIYWFHPLVWLAYILFCRDIELACDEKVIKDMEINEKKAYSHALVSCSMNRRIMMISPLAFGEVGVKARVKAILHYKKPAFWIVVLTAAVCIIVAVCFLTNPRTDVYDIKIVIPAGSEQPFSYSDMEISPKKDYVILSSGEGLGDTEVVLKPIEAKKEDIYEPTYMTPGLSVKMYAEKDAWFQIGVAAVSNPTDTDMIVYIHAEGVTVRIADSDTSGKIQYHGQWYDKAALSDETITWLAWYNNLSPDEQLAVNSVPSDLYDLIGYDSNDSSPIITEDAEWNTESETEPESEQAEPDLNAAITDAILRENTPYYVVKGFACSDFVPLETISATPTAEDPHHTITCYGWALFQIYDISEQGIKDINGSHIPVALTFTLDTDGYQLVEYWQPRDGSFYVSDIREKFPAHVADDAIDSQKFIVQQIQSCYRQAVESSGIDTDTIIEKLLETLCSTPKASSNPYDYIDAEPIIYRELIYYGKYTLRYCMNRFHHGNETGLEGKLMAIICETLLQTKGSLPLDADNAATGQLWYDTLLAHAGNLVE